MSIVDHCLIFLLPFKELLHYTFCNDTIENNELYNQHLYLSDAQHLHGFTFTEGDSTINRKV